MKILVQEHRPILVKVKHSFSKLIHEYKLQKRGKIHDSLVSSNDFNFSTIHSGLVELQFSFPKTTGTSGSGPPEKGRM